MRRRPARRRAPGLPGGHEPDDLRYDVGISNIFARELPDGAGVVAKRLSASLSIHDPKTSSLRHDIVVPGNIVTIGADRYCVTAVDYGSDPKPGSVFLQKLAPWLKAFFGARFA